MSEQLGKTLVLIGLGLVALGSLLWLLGRLPWFGNLPGDIHIERPGWRLSILLGTSLLLSILLTLLLNMIGRR
ncbi:MAG: DUF2905 domain-containing protein [Bacteroidetes bacterium]|nr:DUF2905 domain-containing protein [Rhodothermia bacterium]MCS7155165.1 DUF2905 domain-containing protein [Bacteroidota bacterium]MCX7906208.1 DUF2905 domain-containing protein [Bacteroidota bacterium]MDW8138335.1 DUF2905 domain-containing protein [Bacteroidota bacterium]MDW8286020.1 DUF2905 domain-containing protein [Bacteroidota bacterium]